jgi:hypothetical protein
VLAEYERGFADAERLRASSLDARGNVIRPVSLKASIELRCRVAKDATKGLWQLDEVQHVIEFFEAIQPLLYEMDIEIARKLVRAYKTLIARYET